MFPVGSLHPIAATLLLAACSGPGGRTSRPQPVRDLVGARHRAVEVEQPARGAGYDAEHTFVLSNAGSQVLTFTEARTTTSTTVTWEGHPRPLRIEPGASVELPVRARADGKSFKRGRALLLSSTGEEVELVLEIRVRPGRTRRCPASSRLPFEVAGVSRQIRTRGRPHRPRQNRKGA